MRLSFDSSLMLLSFYVLSTTLALPASQNKGSTNLKLFKRDVDRPTTSTISTDVPIEFIDHGGRWYTNLTVGSLELTLMVDTGSGSL